MATMIDVNCKCCGKQFAARLSDRKRGWAKFCSKSCKAIKQTQKRGHYKRNSSRNYRNSGVRREKYIAFANEYGGDPIFDRHGDYQGFIPEPFSNEE